MVKVHLNESNPGHAGRPGQRGGSAPGKGTITTPGGNKIPMVKYQNLDSLESFDIGEVADKLGMDSNPPGNVATKHLASLGYKMVGIPKAFDYRESDEADTYSRHAQAKGYKVFNYGGGSDTYVLVLAKKTK